MGIQSINQSGLGSGKFASINGAVKKRYSETDFLVVAGGGAGGGGAQPGDSPAVAYIKTHRQKWISWLTAQNIHHTGVDHARHSTEVHERFFAAAAAEAEDVGQDPAAKRQKTTEST